MPNKSTNYKLEYFKQGSYYSAASDLRRFFTLDYNLESYVGIIGVGVISGWTINEVSGLIGLTVQIIPGQGIINGYFAESPYVVKQRSDMNIPDREICAINENEVPQENLTTTQRTHYINVVQAYDPTYNPVGDIENSYVKVSVPSTVNLYDNEDNYIYAEFRILVGNKYYPYPLLNDFPSPLPGQPPKRKDYGQWNYESFKNAYNTWNNKVSEIHNYQWYTNSDNHFTEVKFTIFTSYIKSSSKVLIGKVVTRSGSIYKIDTSGVENLANLQSQIKRYATEYLVEHRHGGTNFFDPPKINLNTDIRDAILYDYDSESGRAIYTIMDKQDTSTTSGHKHGYKIDSNGDGQTYSLIGSGSLHFHKISAYTIESPETNAYSVEDHTHTILTTDPTNVWSANSHYNIYVNDVLFGDDTTSYIDADSTTTLITFQRGISASYSKYSSSFKVTLVDPITSTSAEYNYSFENKDVSVYHFLLRMMVDYNNEFYDYYHETTTETSANSSGISANIETNFTNHPFLFFDTDGNIITTITDLKNQSSAAQSLLDKVGDEFIFTPNVARDISIVLTEKGYVDEAQIEILGNTEVTGTLSADNILYINANKVLTGEFIPSVIPFISHVGRLQ